MSACPPLVLVADDEPAVARAICRSLESSYRTAPPVLSLVELQSALECHRPAVVLLDVRFQNDESSLDSLPALAAAHPECRFIVLASHPRPAPVGLAFASGARGYLAKPSGMAEMGAAIEATLAGRVYLTLDPEVRGRCGIVSFASPLSPCQEAVFDLLRCGLSHATIAMRLRRSQKTVEKHVQHVRRKLAVQGRHTRVRWTHSVVSGRET